MDRDIPIFVGDSELSFSHQLIAGPLERGPSRIARLCIETANPASAGIMFGGCEQLIGDTAMTVIGMAIQVIDVTVGLDQNIAYRQIASVCSHEDYMTAGNAPLITVGIETSRRPG